MHGETLKKVVRYGCMGGAKVQHWQGAWRCWNIWGCLCTLIAYKQIDGQM